jgi:hypothetical protein
VKLQPWYRSTIIRLLTYARAAYVTIIARKPNILLFGNKHLEAASSEKTS